MKKKLTSKKALEELKENAKEISKWELERLNIIEKDLKILEIFKKEMSIKTDYIVTEKYDIKYEYVEFYISSLYEKFKEDFKKIKEWLLND